jgi:hypothetical protein
MVARIVHPRTLSFWLVGAWLLCQPAFAQERSISSPTISVLTFGPGDQAFSKFGHDAVWVHDPKEPPHRRDLVFNYGTFTFDSPWLVLDFLEGKLIYWLSVSTLQSTLRAYQKDNRSVSAQELNLDRFAAEQIAQFLHQNAKPENRYYLYDYYRDNCATRIRDLLDRQLEGRLAAASRRPATLTYRQHTRRLTADSPLLFFALDLAMGPLIDEQISEWDEMFLPSRLAAKLTQVSDTFDPPLVREQALLVAADRSPERSAPPAFWGWLIAGLGAGALMVCLGRLRARRWARMAFALLWSGLGLLWGFLGAGLLILWAFTDHEVAYWNQNVLLCPVWLLAYPVLGRDLARALPQRLKLARRLALLTAASSVLALVLYALLPQSNGPALCLLLPLWLGMSLALWERSGGPPQLAQSD